MIRFFHKISFQTNRKNAETDKPSNVSLGDCNQYVRDDYVLCKWIFLYLRTKYTVTVSRPLWLGHWFHFGLREFTSKWNRKKPHSIELIRLQFNSLLLKILWQPAYDRRLSSGNTFLLVRFLLSQTWLVFLTHLCIRNAFDLIPLSLVALLFRKPLLDWIFFFWILY